MSGSLRLLVAPLVLGLAFWLAWESRSAACGSYCTYSWSQQSTNLMIAGGVLALLSLWWTWRGILRGTPTRSRRRLSALCPEPGDRHLHRALRQRVHHLGGSLPEGSGDDQPCESVHRAPRAGLRSRT